jgi:hypothetical protein
MGAPGVAQGHPSGIIRDPQRNSRTPKHADRNIPLLTSTHARPVFCRRGRAGCPVMDTHDRFPNHQLAVQELPDAFLACDQHPLAERDRWGPLPIPADTMTSCPSGPGGEQQSSTDRTTDVCARSLYSEAAFWQSWSPQWQSPVAPVLNQTG